MNFKKFFPIVACLVVLFFCQVVCRAQDIVAVTIVPAAAPPTVAAGTLKQFVANGITSGGATVVLQNGTVKWSSDSPANAKFGDENSGFLTGILPGNAVITATVVSLDTSFKDTL
jgi:hypothetical protein